MFEVKTLSSDAYASNSSARDLIWVFAVSTNTMGGTDNGNNRPPVYLSVQRAQRSLSEAGEPPGPKAASRLPPRVHHDETVGPFHRHVVLRQVRVNTWIALEIIQHRILG